MASSTMKNIQEICAVIDRSGSMMGKEDDTIGGINETLRVLRETKTINIDINVSLKLFDHQQILLARCEPIENINNLTRDDFRPRGQTALLDAMGDTLTYFMEKKLLNPNAYSSCFIYVTTDGMENASKRYTNKKITDMIKHADEIYNIKLLYLGANQDAILEANKFGLSSTQAMNYSENTENVREAYRSLAEATVRTRTGGVAAFTQTERAKSQLS